jgi:predicted transcriptional regulator of viral defense system
MPGRRVVCLDEEVVNGLLRLLSRLKPVLVAEVTEPSERAVAESEPSRVTIGVLRGMILSVMRPGEKYAADKVVNLIRERYGVEVDRRRVSDVMMKMCRKGLLVRVDEGVYALPESKPSERAVYSKTVHDMVISVMEPGKTYSRSEILRLVEEKYGVRLPEGTLDSALTRLVLVGKLRRVERGVYQLA